MSGPMIVFLGVLVFTVIVIVLVFLILGARRMLVPSGPVHLVRTEVENLTIPAGGKLLNAVSGNGLFVSSAWGGGGPCAQCLGRVLEGGGEILDTEKGHINRKEAREGYRLSCQV